MTPYIRQPLSAVQLSSGPGADGYFPKQMYFVIILHCLFTQTLKKCEIAVERFGTLLA